MGETEQRLARMRSAPELLAALVLGCADEGLSRRPAPGAWSITEILCHLRDVEEFYLQRVQIILANEDPVLPGFDPDRWAVERQYGRCAARPALEVFTTRRAETLGVLEKLGEDLWERAGSHPLRGRMTVRRIVHGWAKHDDEHADQIRRALEGKA